MKERVDWLLLAIERTGAKAAVLSAWGCGAYGLDPSMVASIFKRRLANSPLQEVTFSILNDHNGHNNFEVFDRIIS